MDHPELLYATTNPGKLDEVSKYLDGELTVKSPKDYGIELDVAETGETLEENAELKVWAYRAEAPPEVIVMADDTGLEIEALNGEPGVKVRRWLDGITDATDQQIIDHCLERMRDVPEGKRGARFRTVIAVSVPDGSEEQFEGTLRGELAVDRDHALEHRWPGFPFRGLLYVTEAGCYLGELEDNPDARVLTHRQQAVQKAVDWLNDYNKSA